MNKQMKRNKDGSIRSRGIEWVGGILEDGTLLDNGYTSNPVAGCHYGCEWDMPDGSTAQCYAKTVAEGLAQGAYPDGFAPMNNGAREVYWNEKEGLTWHKKKTPSEIFVGSQADLWGPWVPDHMIFAILNEMQYAKQHRYYTLTKYPVRMEQFYVPLNVWLGASVPPTLMRGQRVNQERMLLNTVKSLRWAGGGVRWLFVEPLSFDVAGVLEKCDFPLNEAFQWAVIGAASKGPKTYQPKPEWVLRLVDILDAHEIPIFMKGNLNWGDWREDKPEGQAFWKGDVFRWGRWGQKWEKNDEAKSVGEGGTDGGTNSAQSGAQKASGGVGAA